MLENVFGVAHFRSNLEKSFSDFLKTLKNVESTSEQISHSSVGLLNDLTVSIYEKVSSNDDSKKLDENFKFCLINKATENNIFVEEREFISILTIGSSLLKLVQKLIVYVEADIQRLKNKSTMTKNPCVERFSKENLCPICHGNEESQVEPLCSRTCQYLVKTCFNRTGNDYMAFGSIAKGYSMIIGDIEQALFQLKVR